MVQASAILPKDGVVWIPVLEFDGTKYPLVQRRTVVGRGSDVDVVIAGRGLSRRHFQIVWDGKRAEIEDLGSTNGTELDGQRVTRAALPDRCTITAGEARIVMGVIPQQQARYQALVDSGRPPQSKETS
jgi:pSer/pThr/pTyr-binding forkhead associated (FHA) protein